MELTIINTSRLAFGSYPSTEAMLKPSLSLSKPLEKAKTVSQTQEEERHGPNQVSMNTKPEPRPDS
jgi:hypothetical protein